MHEGSSHQTPARPARKTVAAQLVSHLSDSGVSAATLSNFKLTNQEEGHATCCINDSDSRAGRLLDYVCVPLPLRYASLVAQGHNSKFTGLGEVGKGSFRLCPAALPL